MARARARPLKATTNCCATCARSWRRRARAYQAIDNLRVQVYWQVGERIAREELRHQARASYGERSLPHAPVLAVYFIRYEFLAVRARKCQELWADGLNGQHRFLGSVRRECLDHLLILGEAHLRRVLCEYVRYFNRDRPHQGLAQGVPGASERRAPRLKADGSVRATPILGGLHHAYARSA